MKNIKISLVLLLGGLSLLWWLSDQTVWSSIPHLFAWRALLLQYTGVLGIGVMSVAMILAVRPVLLEPYLGGLDKMYRLHKWLGITGLLLAISHWLIAKVPQWAVSLGILARPARGGRSAAVEHPVGVFFMNQRDWAETLGEWAFYALVVLVLLALIKHFPYRSIFKTHRLLALVYLALVWHSLVLLRFEYWGALLGPVMVVLLGAGSIAAVIVLFGRVGQRRRVAGEVVAVQHYDSLNIIEVDIQLKGQWPGHQSGQFAFVTLHEDEGPHPYTIASAWTGNQRITFIIKALGDYTRTLAARVQSGDAVSVEGPYGQFTFEGEQQRQVWIGAGVGITPFIARMQALALGSDGKPVDLFHTTAVYADHAIERLKQDAQAAEVRLHVLWDERDGWLNAARIAETVPDWRDAEFWFCGPERFGKALKQELTALGLPAQRFHQEVFNLR